MFYNLISRVKKRSIFKIERKKDIRLSPLNVNAGPVERPLAH